MMKFLVTVSQSSKPLSYTTLALTSALTTFIFHDFPGLAM